MKEIIKKIHALPKGSTTSDGWTFRRLRVPFNLFVKRYLAHTVSGIHRFETQQIR